MSTPKICEVCGHTVESRVAAGRVHEYRRGLELPVPDTFAIPTCSSCGEIYLSEQGYEELAAAQKPAFLEWQKAHIAELVRVLQEKHDVRLRDIERACGVTATYLSHLLGGRNEASQVLINLLEAFTLSAEEFDRKLNSVSWDQARQALASAPQFHRFPYRPGAAGASLTRAAAPAGYSQDAAASLKWKPGADVYAAALSANDFKVAS